MADKPKKTRCWMFHDWNRWELLQNNELTRVEDNSRVGFTAIQRRICKRCNLTQYHTKQYFTV